MNVLVDSALYGQGDPNLLVPLKTDVSRADHGVSMQSSLMGASGLDSSRSGGPIAQGISSSTIRPGRTRTPRSG